MAAGHYTVLAATPHCGSDHAEVTFFGNLGLVTGDSLMDSKFGTVQVYLFALYLDIYTGVFIAGHLAVK